MSATENRPGHLRSVAEKLATEAAAFVRRRRDEVFGATHAPASNDAVRAKSTPTDPVTVVDTETERLLRDRLAQLRPGEPVLGEEDGGPADPAATPAGTVTWVLDPIDGTVNFVYGIPAYAVSVGAQIDGVSVAGAVADVVGGRVYSAAAGLGAHVSDEPTASSRCGAPPSTICRWRWWAPGSRICQSGAARPGGAAGQLLPVVRDVRRIGSAALDLCMVAAGRLDAYYEHGLNVWDWAAGALIAAEAGARVLLPSRADPAGTPAWWSPRRPGSPTNCSRPWSDSAAWPRFRAERSNTGGQQVPAWIFDSSAGSAGSVAPGRRLASTASMSSLCASALNSVPSARSTESSVRWSWNSSAHGATSHTAAAAACPAVAEPDLALAGQPGVGIDRIVGGGRLGETQIAQRAGDVGGLTALAAGVEHADFGVGEFGRRDVDIVLRDTCLPRCGWRRIRRRGGGLHTAASCTSAGRVSAIAQTTPVATRGRPARRSRAGSCAAERADRACRRRYLR